MAKRRITPKNSVGRKRLMALVNHIEKNLKNPRWAKFFDMSQWLDGEVNKAYIRKHGAPKDGKRIVVNRECGTSGCLLGHAVNVPIIAKAGLRAEWKDKSLGSDESEIFPALHVDGQEDLGIMCQDLFGISGQRADQAFTYHGQGGDISAVTPGEAVAHLRLVIAQIDAKEGWIK